MAVKRLLTWSTSGALVIAVAIVSAPPSGAQPVDLAPQDLSKVTRDGWSLDITITGEKVNSVPNLAAAVTSREAFVTLSATATATGGSAPITDSDFITGYQLGCQTDVSNGIQLGGAIGAGPSVGLGSPLANLGQSSANFGIAAGASGFAQGIIQPGVIAEVPMANMPLGANGVAMLDIENIHIKADACGGAVTIRSYAYLRTSTDAAHSQLAVYGDPITI